MICPYSFVVLQRSSVEIVASGLKEYPVEVALSFSMALIEFTLTTPITTPVVYMKPCSRIAVSSFEGYCIGSAMKEHIDNATMTASMYSGTSVRSYETADTVTKKVRTVGNRK